ncbi:MAG: hypothetical protein ACK40X_04340, partial [Armatimonadota bacterium]
ATMVFPSKISPFLIIFKASFKENSFIFSIISPSSKFCFHFFKSVARKRKGDNCEMTTGARVTSNDYRPSFVHTTNFATP